eukprot:gene21826-8474_t
MPPPPLEWALVPPTLMMDNYAHVTFCHLEFWKIDISEYFRISEYFPIATHFHPTLSPLACKLPTPTQHTQKEPAVEGPDPRIVTA